MEISLEWLQDFVELPPVEQLVKKLVAAGIEVEEVRDPAAQMASVIVGSVESVTPHPDADRLRVCTVFDGRTRYQVVCGAPNVSPGQRVPFAPVGTRLPVGVIEGRAIRGVESQGMLCSRADLGLEEKSEGLWDLGGGVEVGAQVAKAARIAPTLVLGITPNRPDLLSHLGVAREVTAATGKRMKASSWRLIEKGPEASSLARVVVDDPSGCKRYVARVVRNLKIGPSPAWLRARLEQVGMRSINNIVDATNYVLLELGQPLHAFDLGRLDIESSLPTIHVRRAGRGEKLTLIDGRALTLDPEDLVIADGTRALALAGVMGGASSEVRDATTAVLLESAYFEPVRVRRTAKRYGIRTEASYRFERGADPGIVVRAIDRCAQLLTEIAGGEVAKGMLEVAPKGELTREVTLRLDQIPRLLGIELSAEAVVQLLEPLEIRVVGRNEGSLRCVVPSFRPDLTREIDLIEELARRHGYDKVPERLPDTGSVYYATAPSEDVRARARAALLASGCTEVVTFGFGNPTLQRMLAPDAGEPLTVLNPLGEELSALRTTLVPGLVAVLEHNQRFGTKDVRIFELGTVFRRRTPAAGEDERDRDLPREMLMAGILVAGGRHGGRWYERGEGADFSDLAGILENLGEAFVLAPPLSRAPASHPTLNPHAAAVLRLGDEIVGYAGQLLPELCQRLELAGPVYVAEVQLAALVRSQRRIDYQPLPRFPGTRRDIAVIAPRTLAAERIRQFLADHAGGNLGPQVVEEVRLFDVYKGKPIPETHVSLAFAIDYRSRDRTLTDREVGEAFAQVQEALERAFEVEVRSAS